jgi:hypothetical protein
VSAFSETRQFGAGVWRSVLQPAFAGPAPRPMVYARLGLSLTWTVREACLRIILGHYWPIGGKVAVHRHHPFAYRPDKSMSSGYT